METLAAKYLFCGDTALTVEFGTCIDAALNARVLALQDQVAAAAIPGVVETVPTFRSLTIYYDPVQLRGAQLRETVDSLLEEDAAPPVVSHWRCTLPVCYRGDWGPDLMEVAAATRLDPEEVIQRHQQPIYRVYMIGFVPGFPYLGDLDPALVLPRRSEPRVRIPAGSVAIASTLTAVYPLESPGGWHLIGHCPVTLFDLAFEPPALLGPGDEVVFRPVTLEEHRDIVQQVAAGRYTVPRERLAGEG
ncbi:MAG: 5-oxoprolinase subunit PxpB [Candidatus Competibacterales bacterium]